MPAMGLSAATDLGLGSSLSQQVDQETEDEKKRRKLGLASSPATQDLFGSGATGGLASITLGMRGARGY